MPRKDVTFYIDDNWIPWAMETKVWNLNHPYQYKDLITSTAYQSFLCLSLEKKLEIVKRWYEKRFRN